MSMHSIFYSDDEEYEFNVQEVSKEQESEVEKTQKYLDQIINQRRYHLTRKAKNSSNKLYQSATEERKIDITETQVENCEINIDQSPKTIMSGDISFCLEESTNQKKLKKPRKSDQNLCKKYHTLANRCLKKLHIYKHVAAYIRKIHKKNYFILVLITSQKCSKLMQFMEMYWELAEEMSQKCKQSIKKTFNGLKEQKKCRQMIKQIQNSLEAMAYFKQGKIFKAVESLYEVETLKRLTFVDQAYKQVLEFEYQITSKGSQI